MRVLVGCETSHQISSRFRARGIKAWSCDLLPADNPLYAPWHWQINVRTPLRLWRNFFDLFIVHPECTYMSSSGLHWNTRGRLVDGRPRSELTDEAVAFAIEMAEESGIENVLMENPIGCLSTRYRKPDQIIQPYEFGDDASKATCLWMKGKLTPIPINPLLYVPPRLVCDHCGTVFVYGMHKCLRCGSHEYKPRWANQTNSGQNALPPSKDRWKKRSETYPGIADAIVDHCIKVLA